MPICHAFPRCQERASPCSHLCHWWSERPREPRELFGARRLARTLAPPDMPPRWWPFVRTLIWFGFGSTKRMCFFNRMAIGERRKPDAKNQTMTAIIVCCISLFIFPFVADCQISFPGFEYTPSISLQIVDKVGKPVPDAYILYEYRGSTPRFPEGSDIYIKDPTIAITEPNKNLVITNK